MKYLDWNLRDHPSHTTFHECYLLPQQCVIYRYFYCVYKQRLLKLRREEKIRMVTIPRKLNMDHLRVHLTSESGMKMEQN